MVEPITAKQIIKRLSPYNLDRVTFRLPDGLPVVVAFIDTDEEGGAVITLSDQADTA
jgi:hypothetical protein